MLFFCPAPLERLFCAACVGRRVDGFRFLSLLRRTSPFFEPSNGAKRKSVRRSNAPKTSERQNVEHSGTPERQNVERSGTSERRKRRTAKQGKGKRRERKESPVRRKRQTFDGTESGLRRDVGKDGTESGLRRKRRCFRFRRVFASRRGDGREKPRNALTGRLKGFPARSRKSLSLPRRGSLRSQIEN